VAVVVVVAAVVVETATATGITKKCSRSPIYRGTDPCGRPVTVALSPLICQVKM